MQILDSYKDPQTKFNEVKNKLQTAQCTEKWINFMLQTETVKDFIKHAFTNKPNNLNMMKRLHTILPPANDTSNTSVIRTSSGRDGGRKNNFME